MGYDLNAFFQPQLTSSSSSLHLLYNAHPTFIYIPELFTLFIGSNQSLRRILLLTDIHHGVDLLSHLTYRTLLQLSTTYLNAPNGPDHI